MGTWDTGPFDNDPAIEAVDAVVNGTFDIAQFRFECGLGALGTDEAASVIALAAVLNGHLPEQHCEAVIDSPFTLDDRQWIRRRAKSILRPGGSELYAMWEHTGELDQWLADVRRYAV